MVDPRWSWSDCWWRFIWRKQCSAGQRPPSSDFSFGPPHFPRFHYSGFNRLTEHLEQILKTIIHFKPLLCWSNAFAPWSSSLRNKYLFSTKKGIIKYNTNHVQFLLCSMALIDCILRFRFRWAVKTKDALGNSSCQGASLISQNNEATTQMSAIWIFLPGMFKFEDNYLFAWSTWSKDL